MIAPSQRKIFPITGENRTTRAGRQRQDILLSVYPGDNVILKLEPHNGFDGNVVAVLVGEHDIGYLARDVVEIIGPALDAALPYRSQVHRLTGGIGEASYYHVEVSIAWLGQVLPAPYPIDRRQKEERFIRLKHEGSFGICRRLGFHKTVKSLGLVTAMFFGSIGLLIVIFWSSIA